MSKYRVLLTNRAKGDLKLLVKRGYNEKKFFEVINRLANNEILSERYKDHSLSGNWDHFRECHITPDWLLIYVKNDDTLILTAMRTGTHSDLFKK
jgi:mRNA interferase YafQ